MAVGSEKQWRVPAFIVLAMLCLVFIGTKVGSRADAEVQLQPPCDGGVLVIPIQLARDSYGLAMIDNAGQTLWVYEFNNRGPAYSRLKLWAARSWQYDRQLQRYNTDEPKPEQVKLLLENLGQPPKEQNQAEQQDTEKNPVEVNEPNELNSGG